MNQPNVPGFENLLLELKKKLNFQVTNVTEIKAGNNNRLFCLKSVLGEKLLAKFYQVDERHRLEREYGAFSFLRSLGFNNIPQVYFKNDQNYFAVYSFEKGLTKKAKVLAKSDLKLIARFFIDLHTIKPTEKFLPAVLACDSIQDYVDNIDQRLDSFTKYASQNYLPKDVPAVLPQGDFAKLVSEKVSEILEGLSQDQIRKPINKDDRRLSINDPGVHNMIFRSDGSICFVDFEYFGLDDPVKLVADFITHDQLLGLPQKLKDYFLDYYLSHSNLATSEFRQRLKIAMQLMQIEWLVSHLFYVLPERIKWRQKADINFDEQKHIKEQMAKFKIRLNQIFPELQT